MIEQLETRDVPAVFLTETTTFTSALTGGTAQLTVTVDDVDDAGEVFRWNYRLENVSVNYSNSGDPAIGIGVFDLVTAAGAVDPASVTTPAGWSVYLGDGNGDPGLVRWSAGGELDPSVLLPGEHADFGFETAAVQLADGFAGYADPGFATGGAGDFVKVPGEALDNSADEPDPQIAITTDLNTKYQQLQDAVAKLSPTLTNGSVKTANDEITKLSGLLDTVEAGKLALANAAPGAATVTAQTNLNDAVTAYNAGLNTFLGVPILAVKVDAKEVDDIRKLVVELIEDSGGDSFRYQGLLELLAPAAQSLDGLRSRLVALNTRAGNLQVVGLDTTVLGAHLTELAGWVSLFRPAVPFVAGDGTGTGIARLDFLMSAYRTAFVAGLDLSNSASSAAKANAEYTALFDLGTTMLANSAQAGGQTYQDARAAYGTPNTNFKTFVEAALAKVADAAQALSAAKAERTATAERLGENGTPLPDLFRNRGLSATISALNSSVLALTGQVTTLFLQINTLMTTFTNDAARQQELLGFKGVYTDLLTACGQAYAPVLALLL